MARKSTCKLFIIFTWSKPSVQNCQNIDNYKKKSKTVHYNFLEDIVLLNFFLCVCRFHLTVSFILNSEHEEIQIVPLFFFFERCMKREQIKAKVPPMKLYQRYGFSFIVVSPRNVFFSLILCETFVLFFMLLFSLY